MRIPACSLLLTLAAVGFLQPMTAARSEGPVFHYDGDVIDVPYDLNPPKQPTFKPTERPGREHDPEGRGLEGRHRRSYTDGVVCDCDYADGDPRSGTVSWPDGAVYSGDLQKGQPSGRGSFAYADGAHYEGTFHGGLPDGHGEYRLPNGDVFTGNFTGGRFNGNGRYAAAGGFVFEGTYVAGRATQGTVTLPQSGEVFEGSFRQGADGNIRIHGEGGYRSPEKGSYFGTWAEGLPEGFGIGTGFLNRYTYKGPWRAGHPDGDTGTLVFPSGTRISGSFTAGRPHGPVAVYAPGKGIFDSAVEQDGRVRISADTPRRPAGPPAAVMTVGTVKFLLNKASVDQLTEYKALLKHAELLSTVAAVAPWLNLLGDLPPLQPRLKPRDMVAEGVGNVVKLAAFDQSDWDAYAMAMRGVPSLVRARLRQEIQFNILYHSKSPQDRKFWEAMLETLK